jgi:hypothetical protein
VVTEAVEAGRIRKEHDGFTGTMATNRPSDAEISASSDRLDLEMPNAENSPYKAIKVNKPSDDNLSAPSNHAEPEALNADHSALLDGSLRSQLPLLKSRPSLPGKDTASPKEGSNPTPPMPVRLELQHSVPLTNRQLERGENEGRKGEECPMAMPTRPQMPDNLRRLLERREARRSSTKPPTFEELIGIAAPKLIRGLARTVVNTTKTEEVARTQGG